MEANQWHNVFLILKGIEYSVLTFLTPPNLLVLSLKFKFYLFQCKKSNPKIQGSSMPFKIQNMSLISFHIPPLLWLSWVIFDTCHSVGLYTDLSVWSQASLCWPLTLSTGRIISQQPRRGLLGRPREREGVVLWLCVYFWSFAALYVFSCDQCSSVLGLLELWEILVQGTFGNWISNTIQGPVVLWWIRDKQGDNHNKSKHSDYLQTNTEQIMEVKKRVTAEIGRASCRERV